MSYTPSRSREGFRCQIYPLDPIHPTRCQRLVLFGILQTGVGQHLGKRSRLLFCMQGNVQLPPKKPQYTVNMGTYRQHMPQYS
ncbi:hypothetical protein GDO78_004566 [Eleutherodactylus coqui]|uniref:Uncharacterized protein n=1 Tax=Eleutherodactylus coqui TaxID=57060 RepID=A0A8J6JZX6_ELECQ|nr:hypothetical protein GDO78_004566 [Eleutherodactylus coqui]